MLGTICCSDVVHWNFNCLILFKKCYDCSGSTPAASTKFRESEIWCPEPVEGHALLLQKAL